ncbi:hypothetical protein ACWD6P_18115 [Streptomyces sp. NPDC002446]
MRIRTTLFALTLTTAALLGGAGTAAADGGSGLGSLLGADGSGSSPMGGPSYGTGLPGKLGADSSAGRGMSDNYPVAFVGRLIGV